MFVRHNIIHVHGNGRLTFSPCSQLLRAATYRSVPFFPLMGNALPSNEKGSRVYSLKAVRLFAQG